MKRSSAVWSNFLVTSPEILPHQKTAGTALVFSTYPIRNPRHGGQLRSEALLDAYGAAFNKVVRCAIFYAPVWSRREYSAQDIPSPADVTEQIVHRPDLEPWILGASPTTSPEVRARVIRMFKEYQPVAVIFEQPFLFRAISGVMEELGLEVPIIYSSQNVEHVMVQEIFKRSGSLGRNEKFVHELKESESELARVSAGTIAVSHEDADVLSAMGAPRVLVQGNGIAPFAHSGSKHNRVRRVMHDLAISSYALYVASSHRPNADSFVDVIGTRLGYLPSDSMIFLAGTVGRILGPLLSETDPVWGRLFWNRAFNWEKVSPSTLSGLIERASCILLPITTGGGSNLKTAEAILSGRPIVATPMAFRGFEEFLDLPNIHICASPEEFQAKVATVLGQQFIPSDTSTAVQRSRVLWEYTLSDLPRWLTETPGA
ncbi:MAG: hypothetical protein JJE28_06635 [Actinomycetales bacterium]|nr:hypothetical protein [Actinomycetales bacterium]